MLVTTISSQSRQENPVSEQDASSDPQNDSTSEALPPSGTPNNQANSAPVTESKKIKKPASRFSYQRSRKRGIRKKYIAAKNPQKNTTGLSNSSKILAEKAKDKLKDKLQNINKYITEDNPAIDNKEIDKKYPIDTLASIFKIRKKDLKIIFWTPILLLVHIIFYYLNWNYLVDLLRIAITAIFLMFVIKNACSAYQNRLIIVDSFKKYPLQFFTTIIAVGGLFALVAPAAMNVLKLIGDSSALTTAILTITGGFIAVFGLIKSHQKSELEREQLDTQKQKDARDHIRQLHSSYSDRFDKAVAELNSGDTKAAFAAVYKLIHLADEWLNYSDLVNVQTDYEKIKKKSMEEVQTIINVLCKYIRTMPKNYTEEDLKNIDFLPKNTRETLNEEAEIRRLIFSEISGRLSRSTVDTHTEEELLSAGKEIPIIRGPWSKFKFNFTQAPMFYPLVNLTIENSDFKDATFYPNSLLLNINFHGIADFSSSTFTYKPDLKYIKFYDNAKFVNVDFKQGALFNEVTFYALADFSTSRFRQLAQFLDCTFWDYTLFSNTRFRCRSEFRDVKINKLALFNKSIFKHDTSFKSINVLGEISFQESIFMQTADFYNVGTVKKLSFYDSQFHGKFKINYNIFNFTSVNFISDLFSYKENHDFGLDKYSTIVKKLFYPGFSKVGLEKDSVTYTHTIPFSTRLFDPSSWDEEKQEYTRVSTSAEPLENSDTEEEKPSE